MKATGTIEKPVMTLNVKEWTLRDRWTVIKAMILKQDIDIYRGNK